MGTRLVDGLDPSYRIAAHWDRHGGSAIDFEVPAKAVRVLVTA